MGRGPRALEQGAFGIAVDPWRSETVRRCGLWLPIRPGADNCPGHIIILDGPYDRDFVGRHTTGLRPAKTADSRLQARLGSGDYQRADGADRR
jgi:anaerobic selenocysteine-containing dehydrogenase